MIVSPAYHKASRCRVKSIGISFVRFEFTISWFSIAQTAFTFARGVLRHDKWDFLGADIDQGFLWYFFYVRRPRGALFRYSRGASRALHWYGKGWSKPWNICEPSRTTVGYGYALADQRPAADEAAEPLDSPPQLDSRSPWELGRAYAYLHYSNLLGAGGARASPCARRQWAFRRAVEDDERFYDLPGEKVGMTVPFFAVW